MIWIFLTTVVFAIFLFVLIAPVLGLVSRNRSPLRFTPVFLIAGVSLSLVRLAGYWTAVYVSRTGQRSIAWAPLAFLMIPEGYLFSDVASLTIAPAVLFSALLTIGSFLWAAVLAWSLSRNSVR